MKYILLLLTTLCSFFCVQAQDDQDAAHEFSKRNQYKRCRHTETVRIRKLNLGAREQALKFREAVRQQETSHEDPEQKKGEMAIVSR